jgi:hypothetical protein
MAHGDPELGREMGRRRRRRRRRRRSSSRG